MVRGSCRIAKFAFHSIRRFTRTLHRPFVFPSSLDWFAVLQVSVYDPLIIVGVPMFCFLPVIIIYTLIEVRH